MPGNSRSGRKPLPTALKQLRGNPGGRPIGADEPRPSAPLPDCPAHLSGAARAAWSEFGVALRGAGIGTALDSVALELLCTAYGNYLAAMAEVAKGGAVLVSQPDDKGQVELTYSPYWRVATQEWAKVKTMLSEFGMTPASRTRLRVEPQDAGAGDEFDQFVKR